MMQERENRQMKLHPYTQCSMGRGVAPLQCGTLVFEAIASTRARKHARSCVDRRLRGFEEGRTAGGAASCEYDGRQGRVRQLHRPSARRLAVCILRRKLRKTRSRQTRSRPDHNFFAFAQSIGAAHGAAGERKDEAVLYTMTVIAANRRRPAHQRVKRRGEA